MIDTVRQRPEFEKRLQALDPRLRLRWGRDNRWHLFRQGRSGGIEGLSHIGPIADAKGRPQPLGENVINTLRQLDTHTRGVRAIIDEAEKAEAVQEKEFDRMRAAVAEDFARELLPGALGRTQMGYSGRTRPETRRKERT